jgi:hypothetical protein
MSFHLTRRLYAPVEELLSSFFFGNGDRNRGGHSLLNRMAHKGARHSSGSAGESEPEMVVIDRHKLGFEGKDDPIEASSGKKKEKGIEAPEHKCAETVQKPVLNVLQGQFRTILRKLATGSFSS